MLSISSLTLVDFGPYRGQQRIDLARDEGVFLIYGPNGRGKTNLHNAFRWALYGYTLDRRRRGAPDSIANSESRKTNGHASFKTILEFTSDDQRYRLTRAWDERSTPQETLLLERNGTPLAQADATRVLNQIAPESVSQFFLFDGEQLRQYEDLLDPNSDDGEALEQAIERVLGIPIIESARLDVEAVGRDAEKQLADQYAAHAETERAARALKEAQDIRDRIQEGVDQISGRIQTTQDRIGELESLISAQRKGERMLGEIDARRAQALELAEDERTAVSDIAEISPSIWRAVLADSAAARLKLTEMKVADAELGLLEAAAAKRDYEHLRRHDDCPSCHRTLPEELRAPMLASLEATGSDGRRATLDSGLTTLRSEVRVLGSIAEASADLAVDRDKRLREVRLKASDVDEEIRRLEGELAGISEDQLREYVSERDERTAQLNRDRTRLSEEGQALTEQEATITRLRSRLQTSKVDVDPRISLRYGVCSQLNELLTAAIATYRQQLRQRVERNASEVFRQLSGEDDYVGLRITDHYGLQIIDSDGDVVRRSAGYEHLVALSLIAALQDSAAVRGPVIMDYPFGRLDAQNTARVVAALPRMARQVVLLSFDGEFDREEALVALGRNLIAEFTLERRTSKHTEIVPRRSY
jgi:DNA sulfur modification protein DndD